MSTPGTSPYILNLCSPDIVADLTVIHYGSTEYMPDQVKPIVNEWVKPMGGLWTSPIHSEWGWKHWCHAEDFRDCIEEESFKLKFETSAKIALIDSVADLELLPIYEPIYSNGFSAFAGFNRYPNFEILREMVDAIWLTEKGQNETRYSRPMSLNGWDCESVFIMNPKCCYKI